MTEAQADLFAVLDKKKSVAAKDRALRLVLEHAPADWTLAAHHAVRALARTQREFTSDDVWTLVEKPREPRALGAVLNSLCKLGVIERTGRYVNTAQVTRHHAPIAVWRAAQ